MSTDEFQDLWKAYDEKLEKSLKLNKKLLEEIGSQKVRRSFSWLMVGKAVIIAFGVAWNIFIGSLLWHFRSEPVFVAAAALSILFTSFVIAGYTVQILLIAHINLSGSILGTQKLLAQLEMVMIQTYRIAFLQAPIYSFFFISRRMIAEAGPGYWMIQVLVTAALTALAIWVYRSIHLGNMQKWWIRKLMNNEGYKSIDRARGFIREIEEYSDERPPIS